jgi:hypothetical protein
MVTRLDADRVALGQPREYVRKGSDARARGRRFFRRVGVLGRPRDVELRYGPLRGAPDEVENDYYRFLNQPRG